MWEKCTECKTGRVYVLRFKNSSRRRFFWMQEVRSLLARLFEREEMSDCAGPRSSRTQVGEDRDEEISKKIQEAIDNPPPPPMAHVDPNALDAMADGDDGGGMGDMVSGARGFLRRGRAGAHHCGARTRSKCWPCSDKAPPRRRAPPTRRRADLLRPHPALRKFSPWLGLY